MDIARLNKKITFQKNMSVVDPIGNHMNEWVDHFTCHATCSNKSGEELDAVGHVVVKERMDFTVRFCKEILWITPIEYRIKMDDQIYNILYVDDMAFHNRSIKFHAERLRDE